MIPNNNLFFRITGKHPTLELLESISLSLNYELLLPTTYARKEILAAGSCEYELTSDAIVKLVSGYALNVGGTVVLTLLPPGWTNYLNLAYSTNLASYNVALFMEKGTKVNAYFAGAGGGILSVILSYM